MIELTKCIELLRSQIDRHRRNGLKEYPTRTILIDPLLEALGWDVRDPDQVELEYPTVDGRAVDYALKINRDPVLLLEAKQLNDPLQDVKAIAQVVGYATNAGIQWCVLSNGVQYKIYRTAEAVTAPEKLLYEVSLDPKDAGGLPIEQVASQIARLSRDSLASGVLDDLGEEIFTTAKVRKALNKLFLDPQPFLVRSIRRLMPDDALTHNQIKLALHWLGSGNPASHRDQLLSWINLDTNADWIPAIALQRASTLNPTTLGGSRRRSWNSLDFSIGCAMTSPPAK